MQRKLLGQTGLFVSELGFGAGGYRGFNSFPEKKAAVLIDVAIEHGINLFDTGPNYSAGNAETRLGRILKERSAEPVVATKVGTRFVNGRHCSRAEGLSSPIKLQKPLSGHPSIG